MTRSRRNRNRTVDTTNTGELYDVGFAREMEDIETAVGAIESATKHISQLHHKSLYAVTSKEEKQLSRQFQNVVDETHDLAQGAKERLCRLQAENKKLLRQNETVRMEQILARERICSTQTEKLLVAMRAHRAAEMKYEQELTRKDNRRVRFVRPDATEAEIHEILESEGGFDGFFAQQILEGGVHEPIKVSYSYTDDEFAKCNGCLSTPWICW